MRKPAAQQGLGGLFQQGDKFVVDELFIRAALCRGPIGRRRDQRTDDGLTADLENAVELGNCAGALGMLEFHALDGFQQLRGFVDQSQAGQIGQQTAQHALQASGGHDFKRISAAGQGYVEQGLVPQRR